jgi:2-polyprenyl-3-methyl-5-hydroxy-6-metoxy-1,4-benzoquinol methylase
MGTFYVTGVVDKEYDSRLTNQMEQVNCNFCGSEDSKLIHKLLDNRLGLPGQYNLVRCNRCELLYLNPQPSWDELESHYPKEYHCYIGSIDNQPSKFIRWAQRYGLKRRYQIIARLKSNGNLLDVGCSTGLFLDEVRRHGTWNVSGVEPVAAAAKYARQQLHLPVLIGTLVEAAFPDSYFDVITLWDVLEHTPNPQSILREIYRILRPGGWVVIKAPDPNSVEASIFGPWWVGFEAPQHLFAFPPPVLESKLAELGFEQIESHHLGSDYTPFMVSVSFWLKAIRRLYLGELAGLLAHSTIGRAFGYPLFSVLRPFGFGSSRIYLSRKPMIQ